MSSSWVGGVVRVQVAGLVVLLMLIGLGESGAQAATTSNTFAPLSSNFFGTFQAGPDSNALNDVAVGPPSSSVFIAESQDIKVAMWSQDPADPGATFLQDFDPYAATGYDAVNIAVDPTTAAVYVADRGILNAPGLARMVSDGAPTPTYTADSNFVPAAFFADLASIAVDPTTHDVIAVDPAAQQIYRLDTTGAVLSSFDGSGTLQSPGAVAVAPSGTIYVIDAADGTVRRFSAAGAPQGTVAIPGGSRAEVLAVEPTTGDLAVTVTRTSGKTIEGFNNAGQRLFSAPLPSNVTDAHGLAWGDNGTRLYASQGRGQVMTLVQVLQAGADAPVAQSTGRNTAHVATVVATGGLSTDVRFEYCPATADCSSYSVSDPNDHHNPWVRGPLHTGLQNAQETVEDDLPLNSNMTWRLRVVATNASVANTSDVSTFASPLVAPGADTGAASSVTEKDAVLNGTVDAVGAQTTYHFEYGLTSAYGNRVPAGAEASAGAGRAPRAVTRTITGLQPGTVYHYRLVARNAAGSSDGVDRTFTTLGTADENAPRRAYEQVTPVDKRGAQVRSDFHFQAAADGSAFAPVVSAAAANAESGNLVANYVTYRGTNGWSDWKPTDPPLNSAAGIFEATTAGISDDFQHALVISNRVLAPGGIEDGGNLYVRDLKTNTYTFVVGAPGADAFRGLSGASQNTTILIKAAPDFSWIVFNWARLITDPVGTAVYRWSRTEGLERMSVMPDGTPSPIRTQQNGFGPQPWASDDGKVVYFSLENGQGGGVYRRANGQTTAVSVSHNPALPVPNVFSGRIVWVSHDGRYAIFNMLQGVPLTADSPPGANVYRYDAQTDQLTFMAPSVGGSYPVGAVSDDGRTVYIETNDPAGYLKVWHDGVLQTVDVTSGGESQMSVSPSGRYFAWAESDGAHFYDRDTGQTSCISCPADGSSGFAHLRWSQSTMSNRVPTVVTDDGTVFFDTAARLVTADHNGASDVYAYKGGRVSLISPGVGNFDARFLDASADGRDVFFATEEGLVGQDADGDWDVYDARIGGGFSAQSPPPGPTPCVRSECGEATPGPSTSAPAGSSNTQVGAQSPKSNVAKPRLALSRVSFGTKSVRITFSASQRGRVTVSGTRVSTTIRNVAKSGTYSITVPLSRKAQSMRRAHKKFKVSLKVTLYGGWGLVSTKYSRTLGK